MTPKLTAGSRLRRDMDAALERAARQLGQPVDWDEADRIALDRAAQAADRAEQLRGAYNRELGGEARVNMLTKLSAEIRALDRLVLEVTRRVNNDLNRALTKVNPRKQRAANRRWNAAGEE